MGPWLSSYAELGESASSAYERRFMNARNFCWIMQSRLYAEIGACLITCNQSRNDCKRAVLNKAHDWHSLKDRLGLVRSIISAKCRVTRTEVLAQIPQAGGRPHPIRLQLPQPTQESPIEDSELSTLGTRLGMLTKITISGVDAEISNHPPLMSVTSIPTN
ncbi:hypothetical protein SAMN05216534_1542 [Candidatus Aquiluna sp. UB-MaderosW2red]|nr:hypothetical protein SAMN05216534_1542 [Candidatus Aquiluna sp. UB-MaderosW2red]